MVLLGEILAFTAIIMCLLFIVVDLGRPDRFLHILPYFGKLNFPQSILAWDVIVLNGYRITSYNVCYTKLLRNRDENERKVILRIGFFAEVFHIKKIRRDKDV